MQRPFLLIVSGAAGTGKTTLARRLAGDLHLPYIGKDDIKERLFDTLGWSDRQWSRKLGGPTYDLLFYFVEAQLKVGRSSLVESNFRPELNGARFTDLQRRYAYDALQILCRTEPGVLLERMRRRGSSGERHPGHVEHLHYAELVSTAQTVEFAPMPITGRVIEVDTTEFMRVDYESILAEAREAMQGSTSI